MNVLSFTSWDGCHDSSAAIVCEGRLVAAAEEERFTRKKHDGGVPIRAIEFCLRAAGLEMREVDYLAFPDLPFRTGRDSQLADLDYDTLRRMQADGAIASRTLLHKRVLNTAVRARLAPNIGMSPAIAAGFQALEEHFSKLPPVRFYDHHLCHAAAVFYTSGIDSAAIATIDGRGGPYSTVTWSADARGIRRLKAQPYTNSLGFFYLDCTAFAGMGAWGEGKLMGLAPYGDPSKFEAQVSRLLDTAGPDWYRYSGKPTAEALGIAARNGQPATAAPYPDFAAACQVALQRAVSRVVESAVVDAGSSNLCLGGGVALNCSNNGLLLASPLAASISIFPAAGDAGLSVGAAILCALEQGAKFVEFPSTPYFGPEFDNAAIEQDLRREPRIRFERADDLPAAIARRLARGEILAWFQGRMELGPRALGNRSILADPRTVEMRDRVNRSKGREMWRPLAPAVLAEHTSEYFDLRAASPYMLFAGGVRPGKRALIPAVVHVDGSARPQTVTADQNRPLHALLKAFQEETGVPVLLNTSFNAAGEPIVCTPEDALRTFLETHLDALAIGPFVVTRADTGAPR